MYRSFAILFLCAACATATAPSAIDQHAVVQASQQFFAARDRGDASAFAAQFTEDGIWGIPGVADVTGRTAIEELAKKRFAGIRTGDLEIHRREIEVNGNTAHELAWFAETNRGQGPAMRMSGRYVIVWKRGADNIWRAQRYFFAYSGAEAL